MKTKFLKTEKERLKENRAFQKTYADLNVPDDCPGISWRKSHITGEIENDSGFDSEMIPLLKELNKLPFCHTTGSCAGHSKKELEANFTKGWGTDIPYRMTITLHIKTDDKSIGEFIKIAQLFSEASNGRFVCELGYGQLDNFQDFNKVTEKGYMPFEMIIYAETKRRRDRLLSKYVKILKEMN